MSRLKILVMFLIITFFLPYNTLFAEAAPMLTLNQAKNLARQQGPTFRLLHIGDEQAREQYSYIRGELGVGIFLSDDLGEDMLDLRALLQEKNTAIRFLRDSIEEWQAELEEMEEDDPERRALRDRIREAEAQKYDYEQEQEDIAYAHRVLFERYHRVKEREDRLKAELDPYERAMEQAEDALYLQPRVLDYSIEEMYLNLLDMENKKEVQENLIKLQERLVETEKIKKELGLTTGIQVEEIKEELRGAEEGLRELEAAEDDLTRAFLSLVGLPLDFNFSLNPGALQAEAEESISFQEMPDLTQTIAYQRAYEDLLDAQEDLEDTSERDVNEYRLAQLQVEEKEIELEETLKDLESHYLSSKEALRNALSALEDARLGRDTARRKMDIANLQYELGLISELDLSRLEIPLAQAEAGLYDARVKKQLARQAYELAREGIETQQF